MYRRFCVFTLAFFAAVSFAGAQERACASREPINTIKDMWPALYACWTPPAGSEGMALTLVFSIRRDGSLIGRPKLTYSTPAGSENLKRAFFASVLEALDQSLPLPITESFGGAIAGRPLALLFRAGGQSHPI
jgi:hypothetical protein